MFDGVLFGDKWALTQNVGGEQSLVWALNRYRIMLFKVNNDICTLAFTPQGIPISGTVKLIRTTKDSGE